MMAIVYSMIGKHQQYQDGLRDGIQEEQSSSIRKLQIQFWEKKHKKPCIVRHHPVFC
jgi:hypothetical protein